MILDYSSTTSIPHTAFFFFFNDTATTEIYTLSLHDALPISFIIRTLLIHEYRKIHLRDPLLPPALLPPNWVGASAYQVCRRLYARVFPAAERHLSVSAHQLHRPLPAANAAAHARFGGIAAALRRRSRVGQN